MSYAINYNEFLISGNGEEPCISVNDNDPAHIMYTSGTTGRPKGAILSHKNQLSNALSVLIERDSSPDEIFLCIPPLFHEAALALTLETVMMGGSTIIQRQFDPAAISETIGKEKITTLFMVPAMWNALLQVPNLGKFNFSSLKLAITGAAILPQSLRKAISGIIPNVKLYDMFGQTEMSPVTTLLKPKDALRKTASVGKPIIGVEIRVVDYHGQDVPVGQVGEIIYRSAGMLLEYYKNSEATEQAIVDGWFHSGDLVRLDSEGFVYVVDRKKDMVISGGENVYPAEVEAVLYNHEKVLEAAVIGIPSGKWGEGVHAVVVLKNGQYISAVELLEYCAAHLAGYKKPRSIDFAEALPRNAAGKVLKTKLREKFGSAMKY
ncbi:AMP-binding protein [Desulfosporosinus sp. BICA1-9]|uniref:AMP-binding protein n=1 Tax=Desulfosporosinus sp. BICA1-9 TaxID=1531958 RepID=UPI000ACC33BF|nr:AMP-binding protein [Desulfosporosinus sp. BICA1-9]HBW35150.1 long-chain fatty acid--CoA ligase [Desulfosporosinus sp.]